MLKTLLTVGLLAFSLPAAFTVAQEVPPAAQAEVNLVGLPVYSSDGERLGEVTEVQSFAGKPILRAELGSFLGFGPSSVLIPQGMFEEKGGRIEVAMSADEVRNTVARQKKR